MDAGIGNHVVEPIEDTFEWRTLIAYPLKGDAVEIDGDGERVGTHELAEVSQGLPLSPIADQCMAHAVDDETGFRARKRDADFGCEVEHTAGRTRTSRVAAGRVHVVRVQYEAA